MRRVALLLILCLPVAGSAQSLTPTVIARTGQAVPDVPGATYTSISQLPRLGANGHVAFHTFLISGVSSSTDSGYWVGTAPGNLQTAIREDSAVVGGPIGFSSTSNVGVDANGRLSAWSTLNQSANMDQRLWGLLPDGDGGSTIVASEGVTAAPGFAGGVFSAIGAGQATNDAGVVAFTGSVAGGDAVTMSDFGLFTGTPGNLKLIAREGTTAPGATGTAPVFSSIGTTIFDKRVNASGQIGFAAALSGSGVTGDNTVPFMFGHPTPAVEHWPSPLRPAA